MAKVAEVADQLEKIDTRLRTVSEDMASIKGGLRLAKWLGGIAVSLLAIAVTVMGGIAGYVTRYGESHVREIARQVAREEIAYRSSFSQGGRFTAANRVSENPLAFRWGLNVPVEPGQVAYVTAEPLQPLPGVAITAQMAHDAKSCVMTLHGSDEALRNLTLPIDAKMTVYAR